ncbi:RNA-directed DNA polymerase [Leptospira meyeri]|uniref:RNA-directed DNA polymerase n=1 Tax=Leptospira meyeri TaxID=29508 RepID=UPI00055F5315|nr:RNA-directed DNA polymerase [Leptospira meyeri]
MNFLKRFFKGKKEKKKGAFFSSIEEVKKLKFDFVVSRISAHTKSDLLVEPTGYYDLEWFVKNRRSDLFNVIHSFYSPSKKITLNMPKGNFSYRPVSYLLPMDSLIYLAVTEKLIFYTKDKFSKFVYSNLLNPFDKKEVFSEPVKHWLRMRNTIRSNYKTNSLDKYYSADISGYFENIKIKYLLKKAKFYIGKHEVSYTKYLKKLLEKWQYADSQGLIQPHPASSILGKIYLSPVDSYFSYLGKRYSRYVDEFHIQTDDLSEMLNITIHLNEQLRELGLNLNSKKTIFKIGKDIWDEINENQDFFSAVDYAQRIRKKDELAEAIVEQKFMEITSNFQKFDPKIFRYCLRRYAKKLNPRGIRYIIENFEKHSDCTVDMVRYLGLFANNYRHSKRISKFVLSYLNDPSENIYKWVEIWLLSLLYEFNNKIYIQPEVIKSILIKAENDELSRAICYMIMGKLMEDHDLLICIEQYKKEKSTIVKRALLCCISRLTTTAKENAFNKVNSEETNLYFLKEYLKNNEFNFQKHSIIY